MDELRRRNRTEPERKPEPLSQPVPYQMPVILQCAIPEAAAQIRMDLQEMKTMENSTIRYLDSISSRQREQATRAQMDELLKRIRHLEEMAEQAGREKEKRFSLPKFHLPRLHLPDWDWPAVVLFLMGMVATALVALYFISGCDWSNLRLHP